MSKYDVIEKPEDRKLAREIVDANWGRRQFFVEEIADHCATERALALAVADVERLRPIAEEGKYHLHIQQDRDRLRLMSIEALAAVDGAQ